MTNERIPNDPYRPGLDRQGLDRQGLGDEYEYRNPRIDPEFGEGPASGAKVALLAICIALVLGAIFYGLNNSSVNQASTPPPARTADTQPATPQAPPGMRDVTPKPNSGPGMTTGAAPDKK